VHRIVVIGNTGSGKSTLAAALARCLELRHIELDAFMHEPNWTPARPEVFRERVERAVATERWVVDGNYGQVRDIVWPRADMVVWLDYTLPRVLLQLFRRTMRRLATREELWNGNRERWRTHFLSRESLFLWAIQTHRRRRREWPEHFRDLKHQHLSVVRLRSPGATSTWVERICVISARWSPGNEPRSRASFLPQPAHDEQGR
jgi:adenylate kinase family enzyme